MVRPTLPSDRFEAQLRRSLAVWVRQARDLLAARQSAGGLPWDGTAEALTQALRRAHGALVDLERAAGRERQARSRSLKQELATLHDAWLQAAARGDEN